MFMLAIILVIVGCITSVACSIWLLIEIFKTGLLWGLASLFFPIVSFIWLITHLEDGLKPFLGSLAGLGMLYFGATLYHL
jgi:hypothetical protein